MSETLVLPARVNGPRSSGNGGFAAGSLAALAAPGPGRAVEVTLRRPPPLEVPMTVDAGVGWARILDGEEVVAEGREVEDDLVPVAPVPAGVAEAAMAGYPGLRHHPFPTCFACGPAREAGDGLRIFPGPVPGATGLVASVWVPHASLAETGDAADLVRRCGPATTWAALDCVGGWSEDLEGRPCVLGRMTARVDALPVVGERHVVVGRLLGREGRKSLTASTLYDAEDRVVGCARHTWLQVDPATFG